MEIYTTQVDGASFGVSGKAFWQRYGTNTSMSSSTPEIALPSGFNLTDTLGSWCEREGRQFALGIGSDNAFIDEFRRFNRLGILPPDVVPALAAASGPGTSGKCQVAIAWYDALLDEWSPLSGASNEVTLSNQGRTTSNIPATPQDSERVTHVGVFVKMNGAAWRLATKRQVGVTSITESVATLALGMAFPATFTRFPRCKVGTIYHERLIAAGDFLHPDVVYVSVAGYPERYGGLSFKTENGEPIVGITVAENDVCLVMTPTSTYELRGWRDNDMSMKLRDPDVGAINNGGVRGAPLAKGKPVVWNRYAIWYYNGAWHNIVQGRQKEWTDFYDANEAVVEQSFAVIDPNSYTLRLYFSSSYGTLTVPASVPNPSAVTVGTIGWRANLSPLLPLVSGEMGQPHWSIDVMSRALECAALVGTPGGGRRDVYLGFADGHVRIDDPTDDDDDTDDYGKRFWLRTKAYDMGDPGGSLDDGKEFYALWSYFQSEAKAWALYVRGGDENAWRTLTPDNTTYWWRENIAASALTISNRTYVEKMVHTHAPQRVTGRCLTLDYTVPTPLNVRFRGFGGLHKPGRASRGVVSVSGS